MRSVIVVGVLVCALCGLSPRPAAAQGDVGIIQIGCAQITKSNNSYQTGFYGRWLTYIVETATSPNVCTVAMLVSAYVEGAAGTASANWGFITATATRQVSVGLAGPWHTRGTHAVLIPIPGIVPTVIEASAGLTASGATIQDRGEPPVEPEAGEEDCTGNEYYWDGDNCIPLNCPIIISVDHKGYHLTSVRNGVPFDLNANGVLERVAWTAPDTEQAFLALDRNGNGRIDGGSELFGNHTPVMPGTSATAPNGFEALRFAQDGGIGAADDVINDRDPVFGRLLLWTDRNHNGLSEPDEVQRLCESGIVAISLTYRAGRRVDRFGNEFRQRGTIQWADGRTEAIFDIWLRRER